MNGRKHQVNQDTSNNHKGWNNKSSHKRTGIICSDPTKKGSTRNDLHRGYARCHKDYQSEYYEPA